MFWSDVIRGAIGALERGVTDIRRCPDPASMAGMVAAIAAMEAVRHPAPQPQTREAAVAAPQARPAARREASKRAVDRGRTCVQVKDEMKQISYMAREGGRSIKEIRAAKPNFRFWHLVESAALSEEDREVALHPHRWATGYSALLLSKLFNVSKLTIRDYITAYNRSVRKKTRIR